MSVREVLRHPHPALTAVAADATAADLERVGADLVDTMRASPRCTGIAATQVGELVRVIAVDVSKHRKAASSHGLLVLANPVVVASSGAEVAREGCLSIPEFTANVRRATHVAIEALGGERVEADGFEARCLLHEIDHLDGILFLDRVESLATDVFRRVRS